MTLYEYFDAAYCPESYNELEVLLKNKIKGEELPKLQGADKLIKEIVYAGKEEFNVPKKYYELFKELNLNYGKFFNQS